jgi:nucleoside-diphosphate-sugar epimerase
MTVFVAGATGAIGRPLVRQLVAGGHEVFAMTRSTEKAELARQLGATPVIADALDADAVGRVVAQAEPDVIVDELTSLEGADFRKMEKALTPTNRLRIEGTANLLAAGRAVGVKRFIAQSWLIGNYAPVGGPVKSEDDPLDPDPPSGTRALFEAVRAHEEMVIGADWTEGIALRYGAFYGPGTSLALDPPGEMTEAIRDRKMPVIGGGGGIWSFIHVEDAAAATVAALENGRRGVYNVVDDEPARVSEWLPALAGAVGAKRPWRVPRWLGVLAAGNGIAMYMTEARGGSNAKAKRDLHWRPGHPSWRQAFASGAV